MTINRKKHLMLSLTLFSFGYNERSELSSASLRASPYAYDNIGNRKMAQEILEEISYDANNINQYTSITREETAFVPTFDTDGNQTLIQSSTGIWSVVYNADNRPVSFTKTETEQTTLIECGYDYMGRRYMKKVTVNGAITLHHRYIYRGYLQIASVDLTRNGHLALWLTMWDPSEPVATRPLAIQKNATWYTYGHDLTKNITELYKTDGTIATAYDYTPYGAVTASGIDQSFQWSSEFYDAELGLVYYNYRHYNPTDGRWINRDPIAEQGGLNLYGFVGNNAIAHNDLVGLNKKITTNKKECSITVTLNIVIYPEKKNVPTDNEMTKIAESIKKSIESHWSGKKKGCCKVNIVANVKAQKTGRYWIYRTIFTSDNFIKISNNPNIVSFVSWGKTGTWGDKVDPWTYAHETGHLMGLGDDYTATIKDGKRTTEAEEGHEGHMMASYLGKVDQHEIDDLLKNTPCPCDEK